MIPHNVLEKFFKHTAPDLNLSLLPDAYDEAFKSSSLTPVQAIDFIIKKMSVVQYDVYHQAISSVNITSLPGLLFIGGEWSVVYEDNSKILIEDKNDKIETFDSLDDVPVSIFVGLRHNEVENGEEGSAYALDDNNYVSIFDIIRHHALSKKRWIYDIIIATVMVNVFTVVTSMFAMQVYDRVVPTLAFSTLYTLAVGMLVIYTTDFLLKIFRSRLLDHKTSFIDQAVSEDVYDHLVSVQMDRLPNQLGTLTGQISGLEGARQFFTSSAVFVLVDFPFCLFFIAMIYLVAGPVAFVYFSFLVISLIIGLICQKMSQRLIKKITSKSNEKLGFLVDSIRGLETIKTFGEKKNVTKRWSMLNKEISNFSLAQKGISTTSSTLASSIGQLAYLTAIIFGVHQISEGLMTQGSMIAVSILGGRVLGPAGQAVSHLIQFENTRQTMEMINGLLKLPREQDTTIRPVMPMHRINNVSLRDISFSYQGQDVSQLDIPSLDIVSGDRIALLGTIGSGKSTLIKLLSRLFRPSQGTIKLDGVDLWQIDEYFININIGYHSQSPELFKGTLKENLMFGRGLSDKHLVSVVNDLGIDKIADQSDKGLDREISEGGAGLSGGQRQMISLGRVLMGSKNIWLFDEPTASLDNQSQERFLKALKARMRPEDILVFSTHNIKMAMEISNRVIVLENGKISKDAPTSAVQIRKTA